jgi:hypothetical protein
VLREGFVVARQIPLLAQCLEDRLHPFPESILRMMILVRASRSARITGGFARVDVLRAPLQGC